ncbi:PDR/VanB family oxidoreductase [Nocardiopsis sp. CC223A]|uniref:PDR/VanB family oxidoreductase n=1 Tax=Nocardiopsis sp. CC223A TaxID=3044051 RepID=UPI00278BF50D|nr:PDR/VanB family oxidoreductase [Nocardiopsis sp. CC223A]
MAGRERARWFDVRVERTEPVTSEVRRIVLDPGGPVAVPPGGHIEVAVQVDGRPQTRCYSLVDDGRDAGRLVVGVRLAPDGRGGSRYMHGLRPGDTLKVCGPRDGFGLLPGRERYLLLAGGIGITPLIGMARVLRDSGADYRIVHAGRSRDAMPFLDGLRADHPGRVECAVSGEGTRLDLAGLVRDAPEGTEVYVCGPMRMVEELRRHWQQAGRPASALRLETFGSSGTHPATEFTVEIPRLGIHATVPRNESMLDALRAAGADMMFDCLRGECGLCEVRVLSTTAPIDHRDVFLSDRQKAAEHTLCTCVSRAVGGHLSIDVP